MNFFNWQGSYGENTGIGIDQSTIFVWVIYFVILIGLIGFFIYREAIFQWYQNTNVIMKMSKRNFWMMISLIGFAFVLFRIISLSIAGYVNIWEILPLHLSRLVLISILVFMFLNKLHLIKYVIYFAISSTLIALIGFKSGLKSDLIKIDWGITSYYFYDYILAHLFILVVPLFCIIITKSYVTKTSLIISFNIFLFTTIVIAFINYLSFTYGIGYWKNSDWFYMGGYQASNKGQLYNLITEMLGPFRILWSNHLIRPFGFTAFFSTLFSLFVIITWLVTKLEFKTEKLKILSLKVKNSEAFIVWKKSKFSIRKSKLIFDLID